MTEFRDLIIMLTSVGILIAFGDWLYRDMPDALDYRAGKLSGADGGSATDGGTFAGEGSGQAARRSNNTRHSSSSVSHSGRGAK